MNISKDYESCRANLDELAKSELARKLDRNEATTRLQLIDALFFNCLGWDQADAVLEEPHGREYADYTFVHPRRILIVEAKREGIYFEVPPEREHLKYSIPGLLRLSDSLKDALEQCTGYCQTRGVPFGVVCNGHQLIAFVATRLDGVGPLEGDALVFPSVDFMRKRFLDLWKALSKPGVEKQHLRSVLLGEALPDLPPKLSGKIVNYPGLKRRNPFQADLQTLSELVLEDVSRAPGLEEEFLKECYCHSGALTQYGMAAKAVLEARYAALFEANIPAPTTVPAVTKGGISPDLLAQSLAKRPILLIGDVGVGKSTFINNLVKVEARGVFEKAISLYIDLGSQATLTTDLHDFVLREVETQLRDKYGVDVRERQFVRGVYNLDLAAFERSYVGDLKGINPEKYLEREIEFLTEKMANREEHLRNTLTHISKGRHKQIVIFLDNADQRTERNYEVQEQAFLIAQEMAQHWPVLVFVALRPETFHRSARTGTLSGYHPKAFTIAPPRVDCVLQKRLQFGLKITSGRVPLHIPHGTLQMELPKLHAVMEAFLQSLERKDDLVLCIDNIATGNIRLALDLVRGFFGSGHVDTEKIVNIQQNRGYTVPLHEFLRAVIYGDSIHYDSSRSPIANLFDVSRPDSKEHFLLPLVIMSLTAKAPTAMEGGFVETGILYEHMQSLGFIPEQIDSAVLRGHKAKMVETAARRAPEVGVPMPDALRATNTGVYHASELVREFAYIDAMTVDTPILEASARAQITEVYSIRDRLLRAEAFVTYLDQSWHALRLNASMWNWVDISTAIRAQMQEIRNRLDQPENGDSGQVPIF